MRFSSSTILLLAASLTLTNALHRLPRQASQSQSQTLHPRQDSPYGAPYDTGDPYDDDDNGDISPMWFPDDYIGGGSDNTGASPTATLSDSSPTDSPDDTVGGSDDLLSSSADEAIPTSVLLPPSSTSNGIVRASATATGTATKTGTSTSSTATPTKSSTGQAVGNGAEHLFVLGGGWKAIFPLGIIAGGMAWGM